eukprot:1161006-Pelagomonas_calceolata.AAC.4
MQHHFDAANIMVPCDAGAAYARPDGSRPHVWMQEALMPTALNARSPHVNGPERTSLQHTCSQAALLNEAVIQPLGKKPAASPPQQGPARKSLRRICVGNLVLPQHCILINSKPSDDYAAHPAGKVYK